MANHVLVVFLQQCIRKAAVTILPELKLSGWLGRQANGMGAVVDYNNGKVAAVHLTELAQQLEEMVTADPPVPVADAVALCRAQKAEWNLPEVDILKVRLIGS